jgi:hypothetical protein
VHGCFGGSDWFQASFRPTHLKPIVNLETGKGWERNIKKGKEERKENNSSLDKATWKGNKSRVAEEHQGFLAERCSNTFGMSLW